MDKPEVVRHRREELGLSQRELAAEVCAARPHALVTEDTVGKIERGRPVEGRLFRPVLICLDLHADPSPAGPGERQSPGAWVRDLRESHGIAAKSFCLAATYRNGEHLARSTLLRIEENKLNPSVPVSGVLEKGFNAFDIPLKKPAIWQAWAQDDPATVLIWDEEISLMAAAMRRSPWLPTALGGAAARPASGGPMGTLARVLYERRHSRAKLPRRVATRWATPVSSDTAQQYERWRATTAS